MKRQIKIALLVGLVSISILHKSYAQSNVAQHKAVFAQALKANDLGTAIQAANYIVAADAKSSFRDSLAVLYFNASNVNAAYYWANTVLAEKPNNASMLEVKALCLKQGQDPLKAIDAYTNLLKVKPSAVYAYELMNLQYSVQRLLECAALGQQTLQANRVDSNLVVYYSMDGKTRLQTPLKAAIYNVFGMALSDLKKYGEAQQAFEQAMLVDSNYGLAQKNLETVKLLKQALEKPVETKNEKPKS